MRVVAILFAALLLASCYVSKGPLITPATADYPFADGAHFDVFYPAGDKWIARGGRTLRRKGGYYIALHSDDMHVLAADEPPPPKPLLLKRVAPNLYVVQLSDSDDPAKVHEYSYDLFTFDGTTAIQYSATCPARREWLARNLVVAMEDTFPQRCVFTSLANLVTVLREAMTNAAPEAKYVLAKRR